jgi:hypothetical protein
MLQPTTLTWLLLGFGWFILLVMLGAQGVMAVRPRSDPAKRLMIGKGEDWRDRTHFKSARGLSVADLALWLPLLLAGSIGVVLSQPWGYVLWASSGVVSVYVSILLWFLEREYVYPAVGPLAYYTYIWGMFVYWGVAVTAYSVARIVRL